MLRGLPLNRMEFKTCSSLDFIMMAAPAAPALVIGAALIGVLLCGSKAVLQPGARR